MKFVLEHVLIGHLLDVQTYKLVSRQDGNSLSAFDILRPQVTAGMWGTSSHGISHRHCEWRHCCNYAATHLLILFIFIFIYSTLIQLPLLTILPVPPTTFLLSRSTPLPSDSGDFSETAQCHSLHRKMTFYFLEHVLLTPTPYWLIHNMS